MRYIRCPRCGATMAERTTEGIIIKSAGRQWQLNMAATIDRFYCCQCREWHTVGSVTKSVLTPAEAN